MEITWQCQSSQETRKLFIIKEASHFWEVIARNLLLQPARIIDSNSQQQKSAQECVTEVFRWWLTHHHKEETYERSWNGLCALLNDSELCELSKTLRQALGSPSNSVLVRSQVVSSPKPYYAKRMHQRIRKRRSSEASNSQDY